MFLIKNFQFPLFKWSYSIRGLCRQSKSVVNIEQHHVHHREVRVCARFAKNFFLFRPWFLRYIPKNGYPIRISYVDTKPDANDDSIKTILLLHGTPGSYYDFFPFIAEFGSKYRIIAPNFPDFTYTIRTGCFWHSAEEKSEFINDFLKDLNIKNIHCMIVHSLATYVASYLWIYSNQENYFKLKSLCLLSPIGLNKFTRLYKIKMKIITQMSRSLVLQKMIPIKWLNIQSSPVQNIFSNYNIAIWKAVTVNLSNYVNYHLRLRTLALLKIPTLFIFSSNDKLYQPEIYYNQLYELQVTADEFDIYELYENNLIQTSKNKSWIKVVDLRSGGHYMHNTHSFLIHSYIDELLNIS